MRVSLGFLLADHIGGALVGLATAAAVHALVVLESDVALAMVIGMGVGMVVHMVVGLLLSPLIGFYQMMVIAGFVGMYGGMFFGMRDAMQMVSWSHTLVVGVAFGVVVTGVVTFYHWALTRAARNGGGEQ